MAGITAVGTQSATQPQSAQGMSGLEARRFLEDFNGNLQDRIGNLAAADNRVKGLESDLNRQLADGIHTAGGISQADYTKEFRGQHAETYRKAEDAATDLSQFVSSNMAGFTAAAANPQAGATPSAADPSPPGVAASVSLGQAADALGKHADLIQGTAPDEASTKTLRTAVGAIGFGLGQAGKQVGGLVGENLTRAAGGFGIVNGALGLGQVSDTVARGQANAGTALQGIGAGAQIGTGLARAAGLSVPLLGEIQIGATALGVTGKLVSTAADKSRNEAEATAVLTAKGVEPGSAKAIAGAGADTLGEFQKIGLSSQQIQAIAKASPDSLKVGGWGEFLSATGLRGDALVNMMKLSGDNGQNLIGQVASQVDSGNSGINALGPVTGRADLISRLEKSPIPMMPLSRNEINFLRAAP